MAQANTSPNTNSSNVNQSALIWSIPPNVSAGVGVAGAGFGSYNALSQGKYGQAFLSALQAYPDLKQLFPETAAQFPETGQYLQQAGQYARGGQNALGLYNNLANGNFSGAISNAQGLTFGAQQLGYLGDTNSAIQGFTGVKPVAYGSGDNATTGYAPYLTAPLGAYQAYQGFKNGNYLQGAIGTAQTIQSAGQIYNGLSTAGTAIAQGGAAAAGTAGAAGAVGTGAAAGAGAAGAGAAGAAGEAGAAGAEAGLASTSTLGAIGTGLGYVAAAYGAYDLGKLALSGGDLSTSDTGRSTLRGAADGASIGSVVPVVGTAIGAVVGAAVGFASGATASSKGVLQKTRDSYREYLAKSGSKLFDAQNFEGTLADGSKFNFGDDGDKLHLDFKDPLIGEGAALGNVIAAGQGLQGKAREAVATMFAKAASTNAKTPEGVAGNMRHFLQQMGLKASDIQANLNKAITDGKIKPEEYKVWSADLNKLGGVEKGSKVRQLNEEEIKAVKAEKEAQKNPDKAPAAATAAAAAAATPPLKYDGPGPGRAPKLSPILPDGSKRKPGDPNQYWIDPKTGKMFGTLMAWRNPGDSGWNGRAGAESANSTMAAPTTDEVLSNLSGFFRSKTRNRKR